MRFATATLALLALAVSPAFADLTVTSKVTHDGSAPQMAMSYLAPDHIRVSQPEGGEVIVDAATGTMTMIDNKKKQYWVMTREDWDAMTKQLSEAMNSPQMQNLPPEVQEKMQALMGSMMTVKVTKTGSSRKVAGYNCDEFLVTIGSMSKTTECVTNDIKLPEQSWARYREFQDRLKSMMGAMGGPMAKNMSAMMEEFRKVKGFPIASNTTVSIMGRTSTSTSELQSVKEGPIDPSVWQVPAGYTRVDSPLKKGMRR